MVFGTTGSESGELSADNASSIALASPGVLSPDDQRDVLQALGNDLCEPTDAAQRVEQRELQGALKDSLDAQSIERFWSRAVAGKTPGQLDTAFFRCRPLTEWMRVRAAAEGVDVAIITAARANLPQAGRG